MQRGAEARHVQVPGERRKVGERWGEKVERCNLCPGLYKPHGGGHAEHACRDRFADPGMTGGGGRGSGTRTPGGDWGGIT